MVNIKVSVIVPVYNAEKYLESSIKGILCQTLKDIEIICVDDGSTDSSFSILEGFAKEDQRIKVISQDNKNAGYARNKGLRLAQGKYLAFLDADDIFEPELLEKTYFAAENNVADIVVFRSNSFNCYSGRYEETPWTIKCDGVEGKAVFSNADVKDLFNSFSGWAWDKLFLREFVEKHGLLFQEQKMINDRFFVESAFSVADRITLLDDVLIHKRINNTGALTTQYFHGCNWKYWLSAITRLKEWLIERSLFEVHKKNYVSFAARSILWNMDKFINGESYGELFEYVRGNLPLLLGCHEIKPELFYNEDDYELVNYLINNTAREYKWNRIISRKDGNYLFPFELVKKGSRIILYGAGEVGKAYYRQIKYSKWCDIVSWVDNNENNQIGGIVGADSVSFEGDVQIIIAILDKTTVYKITEQLVSHNIEPGRIIWRKPEIEL